MRPLVARPFVTAVWSDLVIVSYAVPDHTLATFLPPGLRLDRWEGRTHVSLVAFRFRHTRVWGAPSPPPFRDFPQWNLRFYVRPSKYELAANERGIVFVQEFVPHWAVAASVRLLYHEPYQAAPLTCRATQVGALRRVRYDLTAAGRRHTLAVSGHGPASMPTTGSAEAFLTGQGWGCGRDRRGRPTRFRVTHPPWRVYPVAQCDLAVDFGALYGPAWEFLQDQQPDSVVFCEGSAVAVSPCEPW